MNGPTDLHKTPTPRLAAPPASVLRSLAWIGPMLLLLGTAIGSGELLAEPAAGARYGGSLFWAILFIIITKAFWNEAIGRVSIVNVTVCYALGALICLSTFVLGVAVLRPARVTLKGPELAPELSMMMTRVAGPWAKPVFYVGAYAAVISTAIGILDGGARMYVQPLRRLFPALLERLPPAVCPRIIMTLMVIGCWTVYLLVPDALGLVLWMGAVDAPLVGVLIAAYAYLAKFYLPRAYRRGLAWTLAMFLVGGLYLAIGTFYVLYRLVAS